VSTAFDEYFSEVMVECPYGLPRTAVFRQAVFGRLPAELMEHFLAAGYRRNGNYLYTMACRDCAACEPIRLHPDELVLNRSQKRAWRRNRDLAIAVVPLTVTGEKLALCDKFLRARFPGKGNAAIEYYAGFFVNGLGHTYEVEYRLRGRLVGVAVVDIFPNAVNCVYFYFDPECGKRGLGTYNILYIADFARRKRIAHVYLGYLIREVGAMKYKANFQPHWLLVDGEWRRRGGRGEEKG